MSINKVEEYWAIPFLIIFIICLLVSVFIPEDKPKDPIINQNPVVERNKEPMSERIGKATAKTSKGFVKGFWKGLWDKKKEE